MDSVAEQSKQIRRAMFYTFEELKNTENLTKLVGTKANSLVKMLEWGFPVPEGGCLPTSSFDLFIKENSLEDQLKQLRETLTDQQDRRKLEKTASIMQASIVTGNLPKQSIHQLDRFLSHNPDSRFAVRSSGTKEDLQDASFAGQYATFLNIKSLEHIAEAIKKCWASLFNSRILNYCVNRNIPFQGMELAVIIQKQIPAEKSGVIFTVNPTRGIDKEIVTEACFGLGEALVNGEVTPDHYVYNWYDEIEIQKKIASKERMALPINEAPYVQSDELPAGKKKAPVLNSEELKELSLTTVEIQAAYGYPVDIEWAKWDDKFYILQARPITSLSYNGINGEWSTANFRDGGVSSTVCTPFMWSLYRYIWVRSTPDYIQQARFLDEKEVSKIKWGAMFYGRPYWSLSGIKQALRQLPGFVEKDFDESMDIKPAYEGNGYVTPTNPKTIFKGLLILRALKRNFRIKEKYWPSFKKQRLQKLQELERTDPESLSQKDFFKFFEDFIKKEYYFTEYVYFNSIYTSSNMASLFKEKFDKLKTNTNYLYLISGLTDLSHLLPNYRLWDIKEKIKETPESFSYWKNSSVQELLDLWQQGSNDFYMDEVRKFINEFKFHSPRELDLRIPRYGEDPSFVMESIKNNLDLDPTLSPQILNQKQRNLHKKEREKLFYSLPVHKRKKIDKALKRLRKFLWWREELRDLSTRFYYYVRIYTLILARHFIDMGYIDDTDDIFFLELEDIINILHNCSSIEDTKKLIQKNRLYYNSFRNFNNPDEIGSRLIQTETAFNPDCKRLTGLPCSPGKSTGKIKIIKSIYDADRLERGDILITKYTDPGWTPKFGLLSGVATETGGLLSHAAVISREYGIPAVLAVEGLLDALNEGQTVTLDGDNGTIRVHDEILDKTGF